MSNNLNLINEIWKILKPSIEMGDTNDAAENLVNYLVDEGFEPEEIKTAFGRDKEIKRQLEYYLVEETPHDEDLDDLDLDLFDDSEDDY